MADQLLLARQFDDNANPGAGYIANIYRSGTTTPEVVYTDTGVSIPAGVSVTANATGRFAQTFHPGGVALKCVITTPLGATVETIDPLPVAALSSSAAVSISFSPTGPLPYTNVQTAIEGSVAAAASGFNAFGLGITGNAALLASIDATNIGSGAHRFDNTTAGTYPTGVAAADTGHIVTWRETAASASMWLFHDTTDRVFYRRMASSTWGTWREVIVANQGAAEGDILYRSATNWTRLAKGTAAQILQMNSGATAPEWASGAVGVGQSWQDVSGSRLVSTSYQNTTGKPIQVAINTTGGSNPPIQASTNGSTWVSIATASNDDTGFSFIVPNGHYYRVNGASTIVFWAELR